MCRRRGLRILQQSDWPWCQQWLRIVRTRWLREVRVSGRPRIGVTVGDPAGIGPEIARKAAADLAVSSSCDVVLYGPSADDAIARFDRGRISAAAGRAAYDAIVAATA